MSFDKKVTHLKSPSLHLRKTCLLEIQFVFPGAKDPSIVLRGMHPVSSN